MSSRRRLLVTQLARQDIDDLLLYTERVWGQSQAELYEAALDHAFDELLDFRLIGVAVRRPAHRLRKRPVEHHVIYYRLKGDVVEIIRVLHERADAARHL